MATLQIKQTVREETLPWNINLELIKDYSNLSTTIRISGADDEKQLFDFLVSLESEITKLRHSVWDQMIRTRA